jgi:1,4-alpha-glucan branching enzyme
MTDFILTLHSHLPWVLHHGRWPHGSDWLCEAAVDTYLPLLVGLDMLEHERVASPLTVGVTPILANQLAHPDFVTEVEAFLTQRIEACGEAADEFGATGETDLIPLAGYWRVRYQRLRRRLRRHGGDVIGALRRHAQAGRIELTSSAATHGFLPLLARDESIRLQLILGRAEHRRLFGTEAAGCWVPECAYRPAGPWAPDPSAPKAGVRPGIETHLRESGFRYFFADAHMAEAGQTLGLYGETDFVDGVREPEEVELDRIYPRSPYRAYDLAGTSGQVTALVRDPVSSLRVWSRHQGFPGDGGYLEFHKIKFPGGLKLWRVTGSDVDLGGKEPYDQNVARARAHRHATDYVSLLRSMAEAARPVGGEVIAVPFDTELFGHWWFEGVDFLGDVYRALARQPAVQPVTAWEHLRRREGAVEGGRGRENRTVIQLAEGSWGANGDFSKWLNPGTLWTWQRLWPLEERFWNLARTHLPASPSARLPAWEQATRELLLAQSSDWQFIISTGAAADYAERRFLEHCAGLDALLDGLAAGPEGDGAALAALAGRLHAIDDPFPDPLPVVRAVLAS